MTTGEKEIKKQNKGLSRPFYYLMTKAVEGNGAPPNVTRTAAATPLRGDIPQRVDD